MDEPKRSTPLAPNKVGKRTRLRRPKKGPSRDALPVEEASVKQIQSSDVVKDTFLATVSHELRTPLNGIVGMISMLKDAGPLNEVQQKYLVILMECSHQLMIMMNNMLDFSKMVSNRLALIKAPMSLQKAVEDAAIMVESKVKSKGLSFKMDIQSGLPTLVGDSQRLTQVISNLLTNAVKFIHDRH